ncbi:MAG: transcription antitermination factor NusB [Clostridiales Family XIII bacterium]|jgi:N utilization substance protein B|nr:transcription antitermination factor NusB [Clostridiales Family XIII bacterium]
MRGNKRAKARALLMQMLFQMEFQNDFGESARDCFIERFFEDRAQLSYVYRAHALVRDNRDALDARIELGSENWKVSRMDKVDLSILRIAAAEIFHMEDIPDSVAANEAVELAKVYGGDESARFVNGILGKLIRGKEKERMLL